ncbi:hypothetical protein [Frankia torreyi]|nr:hypothetical protein [Frankia torreyi]
MLIGATEVWQGSARQARARWAARKFNLRERARQLELCEGDLGLIAYGQADADYEPGVALVEALHSLIDERWSCRNDRSNEIRRQGVTGP